jgi:hypothetical protein
MPRRVHHHASDIDAMPVIGAEHAEIGRGDVDRRAIRTPFRG